MKLILVITTVKNGYRVKPNLGKTTLTTDPDAEVDLHEDEYVFESLDHLTAWLPGFLAKQFKEPPILRLGPDTTAAINTKGAGSIDFS